MNFKYIDLGLIEYKKAWDYQEERLHEIVDSKEKGKSSDNYLLFCEHPHVFTLGRSGAENNLLINDHFLEKINATYFRTNRGGDITYHGPGQIVGYPVFNLDELKLGVKEYIFKLEECIIEILNRYNIKSTRLEGATGVWLDAGKPSARKICAIGVRVSKAVTMHGFALNVNTDLKYFSYINPCGFIDKGVTSMQKELGKPLDFEEIKDKLQQLLIKTFSNK